MSINVVKVGTSLLRGEEILSTKDFIDILCSSIAKAKAKGDQLILISSGAVGLGCKRLNLKERPQDLVSLQSVAAIGQVYLMSLYDNAMSKHGIQVAQVLLTRSDFRTKGAYHNASKTLNRLLEWNIVPVINENDALSPEELKYGDNDTLSALVATAIKADNLILLTDIDKLYSSDPKKNIKAEPIQEIRNPEMIFELEKTSSNSGSWGTGGIKTKLTAARIATSSGIKVQLADGRDPRNLGKLLNGKNLGTVFHPKPNPLGSRKSWLAHALEPNGSIYIDEGAENAIQNKGASLLLVGVLRVEGNFLINHPVRVLNLRGKELAKGLISMSSGELKNALNNPSRSQPSPVIIHRDVMVLTGD